jgi:hypothetical protein
MATENTQTKARDVKDVLENLTTGVRPAEESAVIPGKSSQSASHHEMTTDQTLVEPPASRLTEEAEMPEQQVLVPVTNTFDTTPSKERLHELEETFRIKMVAAYKTASEAIQVILTIRDERQYRADGYETFDAYMEDRWHHTRQWVEQMEKHLRMVRLMQDKLGFSPDEARKKLTVYDATILRPLQDDPDVLVAAIKEAEEQYKPTGKKSPKTLKEVVEKWEGCKRLNQKLRPDNDSTPPDGMTQPVTPEEFGLLAQLRRDKSNPRHLGLVGQAKERARTESMPLALALDKVCEVASAVPPDEELLTEARGESLRELVAPLVARVRLWKAADRLKETGALKEAQTAEAELAKVREELAKTPEQRERERRRQEDERRLGEEREAAKAKERQEAHERRVKEQEIWAWYEDELSLSSEADPRKWCEQEHHEGFSSDVLVRTAADCLADALKRLSEMNEADNPITIKAAKKVMQWADRLLEELGD